MRNTRKILIALLVVMTLLVSMATLFASAAAPEKLYLTPNANWKQSNARFAAYFFGNGEKWVSMTDADGDGVYEVDVPAGYPNVIFCRMNPSATANNWNNKWNQTADLTIPTSGANHFTVKEGTWDSGGGTWSTYGSTCLHTNLSAEATCTTPQTCLDCGDPVVSALGHSFNSSHLCTRCNEQASFTVAGSGAHLGSEWDTGNTANDMTYDAETGTYTKVYTNVAAGSYAFKVVRDHSWGTAYPSSDKAYTVATTGSTVTITLKGTTVNVVVEAPHVHSYFYPCDPVCQECYEISNPDAKHDVVHVEAKAATCYENGNVEYWYCSYCGTAWTDEAQTQLTNLKNVVTPMAHAPATHVEAVAPTCYENGNIEYWYCEACGQAWLDEACTQNTNLKAVILPMAHAPATHVEAKAPTCTENGNIEYWLCEACGQAWLDADCTQNTNVLAVVLPAAHNYADGKCTACGAADPDYEAPATNDKLINFTEWDPFAKETYADGDILKLNDIFTFIMSKNSRVDSSSKTWDDFSGTQRFSFGGKTSTGSVPAKNALQITVDGAYTLKIWYVAGGDGRYFALMDSTGAILSSTTTETTKNSQYYAELEIPAAGVYYFGVPADNNYIFQLELVKKEEAPHEHVFVDGKCECGETDPNYVPPHVNTLVVGDTNKIVVSGNFVNDYNLPIEWVPFVADENAFYSFVGDNGALAFIFGADGSLISATGAANLEAGSYLICVGNGAVGEFNVAVTKSAWVNALAIGDNKLLITDALDNGAGYYIVWVAFEVTEKANYTFTGDGILALVYDSAYQAVAGTELEAGTYNVCVAFLTPATTGVATVKVEKTAIGDAPIEPELPALQLGDNTVTIDGSQTNLTGNAVAWYTFTPAEAGTYKFACSDLTVYILTSQNMADLNAYIGADGVAELEAGTMYYILVGKDGVTGEFTVNVESGAAPAHKNTIVVGDNHYIISDSLLATEYEFLLIEITEGGIYKFTGGAPMQVFVFHDPYVGEALDPTAPYTDNIDDITYDYVESFYVNLATPGYYWVGFRYDYVEEAREFDINVSLHSEHNFVEGKCECGETDPNYQAPVDPQPEEELNFFQKILKAITDFFANIVNWFKGLFVKK